MKIVIINGSARRGNTLTAIDAFSILIKSRRMRILLQVESLLPVA